ncbi:MAG: hypothetical protein P8I55_11605 [Crocinitomix sp.]|nr:hypothetical protein [Crocinitomix sp.]
MGNFDFQTAGFESTTEAVLIYNERSGQVVHIHQFVTPSTEKAYSQEEKERLAKDGIPNELKAMPIGVYHLTEKDELDTVTIYSIDVKTRTLVGKKITDLDLPIR